MNVKQKHFLFVLAYFFSLIVIMITTHYTFLGVQDEAQLLATLKFNEPLNYMTSYPLAVIVGYLYNHFPAMQWYSIMMTFYIVLISILMSYYVSSIDISNKILNRLSFGISIIMFTLLIIYLLTEVNVTAPTLTLIALAIPLIRYNQIYFWILVWIASFLRVQIIFSLVPLLAIAYLIVINNMKFYKEKTFLISLIFIVGILFNNFSYTLNKEYKEWMDFTEKRAYFTDFGGGPKGDILTRDEFELARTWWIVDQDLYPYKKVMEAAGNTFDIIRQRLHQHSFPAYTRWLMYQHPFFKWIFIISILLAIYYKSWLKLFGYSFLTIVIILLLIVKNVERVTVPIYLMWMFLVLTDLWYIKDRWRNFVYVIMILIMMQGSYTLYRYLPKPTIKHFNKGENLAKELKTIIHKNNTMKLEITTGFPASWEYLINGIMQDHLFDEKNWVDYYDDLLLQGWFSRVPLVYKQHNVSFDGVTRKYKHYNDWLVSPEAGIIGSKGEGRHLRRFLLTHLLEMYDKKFPRKGCHHEVIVVDESEHFIIHKVIYMCDNKIGKTPLWNLEEHLNEIKTENLRFTQDDKIILEGKDPKFYIKIEKELPKYIVIDIILKSQTDNIFQVFHKYNEKSSYSASEGVTKIIKKGTNHIQILLPSKYLKNTLRVDPTNEDSGEMEIKKFSIYSYEL